jgi:enoyl-[acyl-carrier protein] reductase II
MTAFPNPLTRLIGMRCPIIQAGMSWASSTADLPAAVSNAGGLGVLAAGPMRPADLTEALAELSDRTDAPWAVNIPLYRPGLEEVLDIVARARPPVIIASQGAPGDHLKRFRDLGSTWLHVTAFPRHAVKAFEQGVDAVVVVGMEAGGHPPGNEVSSLVAVRRVLKEVGCPVVAGGGAADGWGIAAMLALGADAVQLGTRFLMTREAAVHENYKHALVQADVDGTMLAGRGGLPVRCLRNDFADRVLAAEAAGLPSADPAAWRSLLAGATLRQAAVQGDVQHGKVEAGQSAGLIDDIPTVADLMARLVDELRQATERLASIATEATGKRESRKGEDAA